MTSKKKKILLVIVLTLLIWTWAYEATEKELPVRATLTVSKADPSTLVTLDDKQQVELNIAVVGPTANINDLRERIEQGLEDLKFAFDAKKFGFTTPGTKTFKLMDYLEVSDKMHDLGVSATACTPGEIEVKVETLVEKQLVVKCYDDNGIQQKEATITPPRVKMFVPKNWAGDSLEAKIRLSAQQVNNARKSQITQQPYIELVPGTQILASPVTIKLPATQTLLDDRVLSGAELAIGYVFSSQTEGKYIVQLIDENELTESLKFRATETAFNAYVSQTYKMLIEVMDSDIAEEGKVITRDVIYNFPHEYIATDEIELTGDPRPARFKLIEVAKTPAEN